MKLLSIDSAITGEGSVSRKVSAAIVAQLTRADPSLTVIRRDLAKDALPHFTLPPVADGVLDEFLGADIVVIGAPMYNFTIPSQLKAWLDRILIAGKTFRYGPNGPEGLAGGKRVVVAISRGGLYGAGTPAAALEHVETYLRGVFAFIGIDAEFVIAEGVNLGEEAKREAVEGALEGAARLAA